MEIPVWLKTAQKYLGVSEVDGPKDNPTIMGFAAFLGAWIKAFFTSESVPWCGLFMGAVFKECLSTVKRPKNPLSALAWASWGQALPRPTPGAILVFKRAGGGHIGLYVGEDRTHYHVLGGNQGNSVSVTRIEKNRRIATRWPPGEDYPACVPLYLKADGTPESVNEA